MNRDGLFRRVVQTAKSVGGVSSTEKKTPPCYELRLFGPGVVPYRNYMLISSSTTRPNNDIPRRYRPFVS